MLKRVGGSTAAGTVAGGLGGALFGGDEPLMDRVRHGATFGGMAGLSAGMLGEVPHAMSALKANPEAAKMHAALSSARSVLPTDKVVRYGTPVAAFIGGAGTSRLNAEKDLNKKEGAVMDTMSPSPLGPAAADLERYRAALQQERESMKDFPGISEDIMRRNAYLRMNDAAQAAKIREFINPILQKRPNENYFVVTGRELNDPTLNYAEIMRSKPGLTAKLMASGRHPYEGQIHESDKYPMNVIYNQDFDLPEIYKTAGVNDALALLGLKTADWKSTAMDAAKAYAPHVLTGAALGAGTGALTAGEGNRGEGAMYGALMGGALGGIGHHALGNATTGRALAVPAIAAAGGAGQGAFINYRNRLSPEERAKLDEQSRNAAMYSMMI